MNNGLDKLPGHAYAPGLEPGWIDMLVNWEKTSSVGVTMPSLLFATVMLVVLVRLVAARPRMKHSGVRARQHNRPPQTAVRDVSVADIVARAVADPNFASEPVQRRPRKPVEEGGV